MDWLFEADRDAERRFPWISIPGVASIVYWIKSLFGTTCGTTLYLTRDPTQQKILSYIFLAQDLGCRFRS